MSDIQDQKFHKMTETPVGSLILRLALPCIVSMLVTSFYNLADTFFVGMLHSNAATGAVGVSFSMMAVIQALGFFFGHGSGNFISRELGNQNYDIASRMAATGFYSALFCGFVIAVLGSIFLGPLSLALGSSDTILPYTRAYLGVILIGAPWMMSSLVLNNQLRFQGSAVYGMVGIVTGAVINIGLDPLLIFVCGMGISGAAWATITSQFVSFCLLYIGCSKGGNLRIRLRNVQLDPRYYFQIVRGGLPSLARQGLASVGSICINHAALPYGDAAIAAMSVVQRIMMFGGSCMIGFGQGFQPVCGYNFGARLYSRVKQGFWFSVRLSTAFLAVVGIIGFAIAPSAVAVFRDDPEVIEIGALALRFQCATFFMLGFITMSNMMLQTIGRTVPATFVASARQGLFLVPALLILTLSPLGLLGLQMAQSVADVLTFACAVPIALYVMRGYPADGVEPGGVRDI